MSSTEARYLRATGSSHLEWQPTLGDIDYLIAAGKVRETLATRLIRLRAEFDTLSQPPNARAPVPLLRSLPGAREYLVAFAMIEARSMKIRAPAEDEIFEIAARVIDLYLDPNCGFCGGRGFTGGYGLPRIRCTACRETGKRRAFWKTDAQEGFARLLQAKIDGKTSRALDEMRKMLHAG